MPRIKSANPDNFTPLTGPSNEPGYMHGASTRQSYIPVAFQVTSPYDYSKCLLPHALVMHVNPANFNESFTKKVERIQTRGGWVEQHWGDDLTEISADGSTGAFMNIYTGLSSILRRRTIAWDRFRDLHDLYRNNGSLYDPSGAIVLQGAIMLMYDKGTYIGTFRTFEFEETADVPFAFHISWTFKVQKIVFQMPMLESGKPVFGPSGRIPAFQGQNKLKAINAGSQEELDKSLVESVVNTGVAAVENTVQQVYDALIGNSLKADAEAKAQLGRDRQAQMTAQTQAVFGTGGKGIPTASGGGALPSGNNTGSRNKP